MPRTPPTIVAPMPNDPRVMSLARAVSLTRREAFAAAAEAWAWMSMQAVDGIVPATAPDSLDGLVDVAGFGDAMLQAGLVGVVGDGLVLPAELRHQQRDERGGAAAAAGDQSAGAKAERRREQNRVAARRYRKTNRVTGSKAKPAGDKAWRSLGRVANHEVRVFEGPHGCYAMVLGATVNGQSVKVTAGEKAWSLDTVRLVDALPGLLKKWERTRNYAPFDEDASNRVLVPSYAEFRDDAARLTMLAKLTAEGDRHADDADASSRHADASAIVSVASADLDAEASRNPQGDKDLGASSASAGRHADALSSKSFLSKSSSREEEEIARQGRKAADRKPDQRDAEPVGMVAYDRNRRLKRAVAERFAAALGEDVEAVLTQWDCARHLLRSRLAAKGIDAGAWVREAAGNAGKPAQARPDIPATTEPCGDDKPATGIVEAHGDDESDEDFEARKARMVEQLRSSMADAAEAVGAELAEAAGA
jgi:hypothetical protein